MAIPASDWAQLNPANSTAPGTIASAATIAPVTFLTVLSGNVAIDNITPPVNHTHMLAIVFAGVAGVTAAGNVAMVKASVAGQAMLLVYNSNTKKYSPVG